MHEWGELGRSYFHSVTEWILNVLVLICHTVDLQRLTSLLSQSGPSTSYFSSVTEWTLNVLLLLVREWTLNVLLLFCHKVDPQRLTSLSQRVDTQRLTSLLSQSGPSTSYFPSFIKWTLDVLLPFCDRERFREISTGKIKRDIMSLEKYDFAPTADNMIFSDC